MSTEMALALTLLIPSLGGIGIAVLGRSPNTREAVTLVTAITLFLLVISLLQEVLAGGRPTLSLTEVMPGLPLVLEIEPLGMLFGCVASGLWIINSLYSIGYMRGHDEPNQTRFYICFAIAFYL